MPLPADMQALVEGLLREGLAAPPGASHADHPGDHGAAGAAAPAGAHHLRCSSAFQQELRAFLGQQVGSSTLQQFPCPVCCADLKASYVCKHWGLLPLPDEHARPWCDGQVWCRALVALQAGMASFLYTVRMHACMHAGGGLARGAPEAGPTAGGAGAARAGANSGRAGRERRRAGRNRAHVRRALRAQAHGAGCAALSIGFV